MCTATLAVRGRRPGTAWFTAADISVLTPPTPPRFGGEEQPARARQSVLKPPPKRVGEAANLRVPAFALPIFGGELL